MNEEPQPRTLHWTPTRDPTSIVVPGVDTSASVTGQIDQIDQLITIRLQNIDANFSRIQHLIAAKLLPAFKRYAESTEPVREAAKFWKSFYEAAAQVRIPVASESSLYQEEHASQAETEEYEETAEQDTSIESSHEANRTPINVATHDDSFTRGAPISSTPLVRDPTNVALPVDDTTDESWAASIESPFVRLGRQVKDLTIGDPTDHPSTSTPSFSAFHGSYTDVLPDTNLTQQNLHDKRDAPTQPSALPRSRKKGKSPLRHNVLRHATLAAASDDSTRVQTPRRNKNPKNPFSSSRKWNGLVDLRQPSPARRTPKASGYHSDSSDDLFPPGMSPPVTMQFAIPARTRPSPVKLTYTPAKKAAEKISRDLVAGASSRNASSTKRRDMFAPKEQSISSVAPSLPSLTRYSGKAPSNYTSSAEYPYSMSAIDRKGDFVTPMHQLHRSRTDPVLQGEPPNRGDSLSQQGSSDSQFQQGLPTHPSRLPSVDEGVPPSPGSDTDSDSEHGESNPSAAFLFATQNNARSTASDDSFASSQSDGDEDDDVRAAQHPLAHMFVGGHEGADDSFDQDDSFVQGGAEEDTVFGARGMGRGGEGQFTLMRDPLIDETYTGVVSLNPFAQVEQSPTPYSGQAGSLERR
ncbi:hypothetical protein BU17DRAFT_79161 [Hysterangium stoloniferum]|nr:hypothetical protein BU17DRAFT_79161 [Hysterangium stoloniferum]